MGRLDLTIRDLNRCSSSSALGRAPPLSILHCPLSDALARKAVYEALADL